MNFHIIHYTSYLILPLRFPFLLSFHQFHFVEKVAGAAEFIYDKKDVAGIYHDIPTNGRIVIQIAHGAFPNAVKIKAYQVTICIKCWRT